MVHIRQDKRNLGRCSLSSIIAGGPAPLIAKWLFGTIEWPMAKRKTRRG
jgi:hypothetical protein